MKLTYNANAQAVGDLARFKAHVLKIKPAMLVIMDGAALAQELARALPDCKVILRNYDSAGTGDGDGDIAKRMDAIAWLDRNQQFAQDGVYLYTSNEPLSTGVTIEQTVSWHVKLMKEAKNRGVRLCVINDGVGSPEPEQWPLYNPVIKLAGANPDLFLYGLHEYAGGVITSGFVGGVPQFIQPDTWPRGEAAKVTTMWHCGRFKFLLKHCADNGLPVPRIAITEHGMDETRDILAWLQGLIKTPPFTDIRGWKTCVNQWRAWWPQWNSVEAYFEQLKYLSENVYNDPAIVGAALFCWNQNPLWKPQFDLSEALGFHALMEAYAEPEAPPAPPPDTPPPDTTPPDWTPSTQAADFSKCGYDTMERVRLNRGIETFTGNDQVALKFTQLTGFITWEGGVADPYAKPGVERGGAFIVPKDAHLDQRQWDDEIYIDRGDNTTWRSIVYRSASNPDWVFVYGQRNSASVDADGNSNWWHVCAPLAIKTADYEGWLAWLTPGTPPTTPPPPLVNGEQIEALKKIRDGINALIAILEQEQSNGT